MALTDGAGLPSYSTLYQNLAAGVPIVVTGIDPGESNLTPEYFIRRHGHEVVTVVNTKTGVDRSLDLATFMQSFDCPPADVDPEKLKVPSSLFLSSRFWF